MREVLSAVLVIGALVAARKFLARLRKRRHRDGLMACFMHAVGEGTFPRLSCVRDRKWFGDGWIDTYRGAAGTMPFTFSVTIEPWVRVKTYRLHLVGEDYAAVADPDREPHEPFVRVHATFRALLEKHERRHLPEAS